MESDPASIDIDYIKEQLIKESQQYEYPKTKIAVKFRYRNIAYDIHRKFKEQSRQKTFLSFGSRRSSSVSNYGNTPIIMRRSISSNGDLAPYGIQSGGSLRGVPPEFEAEASRRLQFGSLRGLPTEKRLSNLDESDEIEGKDKNKASSSRIKDGDSKSRDSWDTASLNNARCSEIKTKIDSKKEGFDVKGSNRNIEKLKQVEVNRSTESLMTVKKKKSWWFKRRKPEIASESSKEPNEFSPVPMSDKASSDINLATHLPQDMSERQEEFHRSQIHLKGYSQKNVAGVNLSVRSSMTNPSVTSRASLAGSDFVNGSTKNIPHPEISISPKEHNQSYEDQFEQSLGSGSASDCKSEEVLVRSRHQSGDIDTSKREAIHLNDLPTLSQAAPVLSPDSRPIRPLQFSSASSMSPPPSPILRQHYSKSSTTESYPHSLMDRPIITRMAKRRSSENSQNNSDAESTAVKKSNIAYTLTFQDEPICVNLRTKSQTLIPETDESMSSKTKSDPNGSVEISYERQVSLPNERETSPGYRPYSSKSPSAKSPVIGKKLIGGSKKNPKVTREKEKMSTDNEVVNNPSSTSLSNENLQINLGEENRNENNLTNRIITSNENSTSTIEVKLEKEIQIVHDIQTVCSVEDVPKVLTDQTNGQLTEEQNGDSQPVCKLKRRNTFTLSSNGETRADKKEEEVTNGKAPDTLQLVLDGSVEKNVTISVSHSPLLDSSHDNGKLEHTESTKNTPTVSSRIPIKRGKGESLSRIPTLSSPSAHSTPTSFIKPPNKITPVAANSPVASHKSFTKSPERTSLKKKGSAIPSFRKPSLDESVVSQISGKNSTMDNFMRVDNNAIVVRRETIIELKTEATSTLCVVM